MKPQSWRGALSLGDGWAIWRGAVGDNALHRHIAAQAVLSADRVRVYAEDGAARSGRTILLDPLVPHRLDGACEAEILFVEPAYAAKLPAEVRRRLPERLRAAPWPSPPPPAPPLPRRVGGDSWRRTCPAGPSRRVCGSFGGALPPPVRGNRRPAVPPLRALATLAARVPDPGGRRRRDLRRPRRRLRRQRALRPHPARDAWRPRHPADLRSLAASFKPTSRRAGIIGG